MRIATWQCEQHPLDVAGNLARLDDAARRAASDGAALLVVPEMFLTGYAIGAEATRRLAEPSDGPSARAVAGSAARHGVAIAYGFPELEGPDGGTVFNSVSLVTPDAGVVATTRKTHLFGPDDRDAFSPGPGGSPVVEFGGFRVGFLICYDVEFPEAVRSLALAGADLVIAPTANMVGFDAVARTLVPARAYENQVHVVYANCCGREGELEYGGLSVVAAPDGTLLAHADRDESWLLTTLDPAHRGRRLNSYLSDRRPDLYGPLTEP